jgi:hypothetical protein
MGAPLKVGNAYYTFEAPRVKERTSTTTGAATPPEMTSPQVTSCLELAYA